MENNSYFARLEPKGALPTAAAVFLGLASIFILLLIIGGIIKLTGSSSLAEGNTITVNGEGKAFAVPDVATIWFTVRKEGKDVSAVQAEVTKATDAVNAALAKLGIEEKDIQTSNYSANPKYEWQRASSLCLNGYCGEGKQVLVGYEVSHTVTVKVREISKAGEVLGAIGGLDVSDINGPNLEVDEPDAVTAEARSEAIADARQKAKDLAKELNVRLGKMVSFSEGGGAYPMYARAEAGMAFDAVAQSKVAPAPSISVGQNEITSNVSITYKIK